MEEVSVLPADSYTVVNKTIMNDIDRKILTLLYQPIIGHIAVSLYFTLWSDLDETEILSPSFTHHHLVTSMKIKIHDIVDARKKLEAVGLLKSYVRKGNINDYVYEIFSPLSADEFLMHPILSVVLFNNIGKKEYSKVKHYFALPAINLKDFENITCSLDEVFGVVPHSNCQAIEDDFRKRNKQEIALKSDFDFDLLKAAIPKDMMNAKTFNRSVKELIRTLAYLYQLDELRMQGLVRDALTERGTVDKKLLRRACMDFYTFESGGKLPNLIYRNQPEYLRKPVGDVSNRAKMIYTFETKSPYVFLKSKYHGSEPLKRDVRLIESLMVDLGLKPGVVNVLVDYVLKTNDNKLNKAFVETIAGQWKRLNIDTVEEAMKLAEKEHKRYKKRTTGQVSPATKKKTESIPAWFDKEIKNDEISEQERKELEAMLAEM